MCGLCHSGMPGVSNSGSQLGSGFGSETEIKEIILADCDMLQASVVIKGLRLLVGYSMGRGRGIGGLQAIAASLL